MDYEEKYNAALERARQFIEHPLQEDSENIAESIFPELTMSEDERIRKALIEMIHDTTGDECEDCYHVSKESVLAWLEKQGEKKNTRKREIDDAYPHETWIFIDGAHWADQHPSTETINRIIELYKHWYSEQ